MSTRKTWLILGTVALAFVLAMRGHGQKQQPTPAGHQHDHMEGMDMGQQDDHHAEHQAVNSMMPGHQHHVAHMRMTAPRPMAAGDEARADAVLKSLRDGIEKYQDYHVALADGYQIFLPNLPQKEYHFTNYRNGFLEAFAFEPSRPTSLLYRKTASGYKLVGAMYTMPKNASEDQLNERVPLSVASWHLHTNLCMPPRNQRATANWTKFGLQGSISTQDACAAAGGNFLPVIFGWMVHVYPYETSPEKIWAHPM
jgi:hypothetical protein